MSAKRKKEREPRSKAQESDVAMAATGSEEDAGVAETSDEPQRASAIGISRPATRLATPPTGDIAKVTVSLVGGAEMAPQLEEITRINQGPSKATRTPVMTVIEAVLARAGGSMSLGDLTSEVQRYWNRPFPGSPYSAEEFVYMMASHSYRVRVSA